MPYSDPETHRGHERRPIPFDRIAVLGAGAWGTALAVAADRAGRRPVLWAREDSVVDSIAGARHNPFLPGVPLPPGISPTAALDVAVRDADLALLACPSEHVRGLARRTEALLGPGVPVVICSKGIEGASGSLMSEVISEEMPGRPLAVLSGPTFATEVARGLPTAVTLAAPLNRTGCFDCDHLGARVAVTFATPSFRPYLTGDVVGVEIGGAVKNVLAIACGVATGRGMGSNARAAIVTRGLAEMTRLALALGGRADTLSGLAGLGDLMLTCSSEQSRNFSYGKALGEGTHAPRGVPDAVVEGKVNARAVVTLAARLGVAMPICEAVHGILDGDSIDDAVTRLMMSRLRPEPLAAEDQIRIPHANEPGREREFLPA